MAMWVIGCEMSVNDPVEPFIVDKRFGGTGFDHHYVTQVSSRLASYLINETGYGRLLQELQSPKKFVEVAKGWQQNSVKQLAQSSLNDKHFAKNWESVLYYLDKIYELAQTQNIKIVLLISPYTFQLMNDNLKEPQKILINHAKSKHIDVIDFTDIFEKLIFDEKSVRQLLENGVTYPEINKLYQKNIARYFLDSNHYSVEGHRIIASELYSALSNYYPFIK
jgi:hypothetical protein